MTDLISFTDLLSKGAMTEDERTELVETLLDKPNLIVADEAHSFKTRGTALWKAMTRFKSKSRVALTASPLSNSLDEYYTIIDWIAPNYLGDPVEFNAHYKEPIQVCDL